MSHVTLSKINNSYIKISTSRDIALELYEKFSFYVPGYEYSPKYKMGYWSGKVSLFDARNGHIYAGLVGDVLSYCTTNGYDVVIDKELKNSFWDEKITREFFMEWIKQIPVCDSDGELIEPYYYQLAGIFKGMKFKRQILKSATGTGKSLIIYLLCRYMQQVVKGRILLLVPNVGLVEQMFTDFRDYSQQDPEWKVFQNVSKIYSGQDKTGLNEIVVSTWQSLQKIGKSKDAFPKEWFEQFAAIIVDEVHLADSSEIKRILELCNLADYRIGLSGTLDKDDLSDHTVRGLLGPVTVIQTTKQAMEDGYISKLNINQLILHYPKGQKKLEDYQAEMDFVCAHESRNKFIVNLATTLKGSTLILVNFVEKHGDILYEQLKAQAGDRKVFYIKGSVSGEDRNAIRAMIEKEVDPITIATYGSFSTGSNVKNIDNVILGHSSKSMVRVLQTIGRGLRKSKTKTHCNLYDIVDFIRSKCHSLNHAEERLKLYREEGFKWSTNNIKL